MKSWVKNSMALGVFVIGVGGSVFYTQFVSPYISDDTVYVATHDMEPNTLLTAQDIQAVRVDRSLVASNSLSPSMIVGQYTSESVSRNQQITSVDTETDPLAITPGTNEVPIDSSWIAAMPSTLRQGDYVDIVPIPPTQQTPSTSVGNKNKPSQSMVSGENGLTNVPVLYVLTSDNHEVTNQPPYDGSGQLAQRDNGSGTPSDLELKLTDTQVQTLQNYIEAGDKLFIWFIPQKQTKETRSDLDVRNWIKTRTSRYRNSPLFHKTRNGFISSS